MWDKTKQNKGANFGNVYLGKSAAAVSTIVSDDFLRKIKLIVSFGDSDCIINADGNKVG